MSPNFFEIFSRGAVVADNQTKAKPKVVEIDGQRVENFSPADEIKGENYAAAAQAVKLPHRGLYFSKLKPSGAAR